MFDNLVKNSEGSYSARITALKRGNYLFKAEILDPANGNTSIGGLFGNTP